jgi:putative endonuclease
VTTAGGTRRAAEREGRRAETLAALYLQCKFYRILARRFRTRAGEIDLIAKRGNTLAFVEVKRRASEAAARAAIAPTSRKRIARAATIFLAQNPQFSACALRLDAVFMTPGGWPIHLEGAWDDTVP